ncbi:nucleotidyltransferase family protein [Burkholderiaceae bacterium DAT-1]|nr:nucleotidyltransferase family protein [Burkholderiaceae bacterium DAT-1]
MILAAGRGERMRPLTDHTPKPLLKVGGKPLIVWHIERLAAAGIRDIVINHAWLGSQFEATLGDGSQWGVRLHYSAEGVGADNQRVGLETAGGIARARHLLGTGCFILVSGDIFCEYDFRSLVDLAPAFLTDTQRLGHLVMVDNPPYHPGGDFSLTDGVLGNEGAKLCYGNLALLKPEIVNSVTPGEAAKLGPIFKAAAAKGQLSGEHFTGTWLNVGTPGDLEAANATIQPA